MHSSFSQVKKHKVFISYHHESDQNYKDKFLQLFAANGADILVDHFIDNDYIDENLQTETIRQKLEMAISTRPLSLLY